MSLDIFPFLRTKKKSEMCSEMLTGAKKTELPLQILYGTCIILNEEIKYTAQYALNKIAWQGEKCKNDRKLPNDPFLRSTLWRGKERESYQAKNTQ